MRVTSSYGWRRGKFHAGVDLRARDGAPLYAVAPGVVAKAVKRDVGAGGKSVVLALDSGWRAGYAHMSRVDVEKRERVVAGTQVGLAGSTGHASGPHLHFELRAPSGALVDPIPYVPAAAVRTASRTEVAAVAVRTASRADAAAVRTTSRVTMSLRASARSAYGEARALLAAVTNAAGQRVRDRRG